MRVYLNSLTRSVRLLIVVVAAAVLLSLGVFVAVYVVLPGSSPTPKDELLKEAAKTALQVIGVGVVGAGIKILYDRTAEEAKKRNEVNAFRQSVLEKLVTPRLEVEQARRMFRLDGPGAPLDKYNEMLRAIVKQRVELGDTWHAVRTAPDAFANSLALLTNIQVIKNYLDTLIEEKQAGLFSEASLAAASPQDALAGLLSLPRFGDFYHAEKYSDFMKDFIGGFESASDAIRRIIWDGRVSYPRPSEAEIEAIEANKALAPVRIVTAP